jgi:hypothetical protein
MKKLVFGLLAFITVLLGSLPASVQADQTYVYPSQLSPRWGFIRKAPCGLGAGDNCGSEPPTWQLTPDFCGVMISTGAARNEAEESAAVGDGATLVFPYTFGIRYATDPEVLVNGVIQTITTNYSVTGMGNPLGGNVTFTAAPPLGQAVVIRRRQFSNQGVRHKLPTVAMFTAAGMGGASGAAGSSGAENREAQCEITFVMGAPGPENYLRVAMEGVALTDKVTPFGQGAYDVHNGDLVFPYLTPGTVKFCWNGNSWLICSATPALAEQMDMGQLSSHGNVRLTRVTADFPWWTAGSNIGKLALCPQNGRGLVGNSNGGNQLTLMQINCIYLDNDTGAAQSSLITMRNIVSANVTNIAQGAAYIAGTAPDGTMYEAGNYVVLHVNAFVNFSSGNTLNVHNIVTAQGNNVEGRFIGKKLVAGVDPGCPAATNCIELHQRINDGAQRNGTDVGTAIAPPSAWIAADTMTSINPVAIHYSSLQRANILTPRETNYRTGTEREATSHRDTVVGIARTVAAVGWTDSPTNRLLVSYFNPVRKEGRCVFTADRTTASLTFVELNSEIRCNFMTSSGVSSILTTLGDLGRRVEYNVSVTASNNTAANGCTFAVGFNGIVAEQANPPGFVNPAGITGGKTNIAFSGSKESLSETTNHYMTLLAKAETGGTCTVYKDNTFITVYIWQ